MPAKSSPDTADLAYQDYILQGVSRTFALTIPLLPPSLERAVGNAYLLCRIADTIEDDADMAFPNKRKFAEQFIDVVRGQRPVEDFARQLGPALSDSATDAERDLVEHSAAVVRITHSLNERQRAAMERCVRIMADGMVYYQGKETLDGVDDQLAMDRYCYYVAGVVGEMLFELFSNEIPELDAHREEMLRLAVSFGQALQMTNILKDIWDDRTRGACWLPRDLFQRHGITLSEVKAGALPDGYRDCIGQLIAVAHGHLHNALRYTLMIPPRETGVRRFCLLALGLAVLTLRRMNARRGFASGAEVKISRRAVKATVAMTGLAARSDAALRALFRA
ncbi:MAG: phytoene/squalene synthase family protein, partial [Gammaproteobacteria bacterium]|nr:phytoene/squalene synthase family protein [Gammaproteobacteria bacterium]